MNDQERHLALAEACERRGIETRYTAMTCDEPEYCSRQLKTCPAAIESCDPKCPKLVMLNIPAPELRKRLEAWTDELDLDLHINRFDGKWRVSYWKQEGNNPIVSVMACDEETARAEAALQAERKEPK